MRSEMSEFERWIEILNGHRQSDMAGAACWVHDTMVTARKIAEDVYGQDWRAHLLGVYDRLNARHTLEQQAE